MPLALALSQTFRLKWSGGGAQASVSFKTSSNDSNKQSPLGTTTLAHSSFVIGEEMEAQGD